MAWVATDEPVGTPAAPDSTSNWQPASGNEWWNPTKHWAGALQTADDAVRAAANAATFGMADRFAGWSTPGSSVDAEVKKSQAARERSPIASVAGDVVGSVAIPGMGGAGLATNLGTRFGPGAVRQFGARALGYGAEGAGIGAAQGAGNTYTGNPEDYLKNAGIGTLIGGGAGGLMGGVLGPRGQVSSAERPNAQQARDYTNNRYAELRANPTPFNSSALATHADRLEQHLQDAGYINVPGYSPASFRAVDRMRDTGQPTVTAAEIDLIRQGLNMIPRGEAAATDRNSGRVVKNWLDDFVANPPQGALGPGATAAEAAEASRLANLARESRMAQGRISMVENVAEKARLDAQASHSGRNVDNLIRQNTKNYFLNPLNQSAEFRLRSYNPGERAALRAIPDATPGQNFIRTVGNMGGGGGGVATPMLAMLGSAAAGGGAGYAVGDDKARGALFGATLAGAGLGLRGIANRAGRARINDARNMIAENSPLYRERLATAPMVPGPGVLSGANVSNARDAITYELLRKQQEATDVP